MAERFIVNVEAAIFRDGRWLMIQRFAQVSHAAGTLSMPGGKVERTDDNDGVLEAAVRREVQEEVGVTLAPSLTYVRSTSFHSDDHQWVVDVVFLAAHETGTPRPGSPEEVAWVGWMSYDEIAADPRTPPWTRRSLQLAERKRVELMAEGVR
ncbi:NUDIX hydrolase [Actinopolymorpha alba]|uniref:NUDIX hydrolase n=1 Tax=Actinopolymorpha alba TaxID=533267 RepID=UPI0003767118|nr:NUDIX hydrolase [Actinopolymorpha alba]